MSDLYELARSAQFYEMVSRAQTHPSEAKYQSVEGNTALHCCARKNAPIEAIQAIIDAAPSTINIKDLHGNTPLDVAVICDANENIIDALRTAKQELVRDALENLFTLESDVKVLTTNFGALSGQLDYVAETCSILRKENNDLKKELSMSKNTHEALGKEMESTTKELRETIEKRDKVNRTQSTVSQNNGTRLEYKELLSTVQALKDEMDGMKQNQIQQFEVQAQQKTEENRTRDSELDRWKHELEQRSLKQQRLLQDRVDDINKQNIAKESQYMTEVGQINSKIGSIGKEMGTLQANIIQLKEDRDGWEFERWKVQDQVEVQKNHLDKVKKDYRDFKKSNRAALDEIKIVIKSVAKVLEDKIKTVVNPKNSNCVKSLQGDSIEEDSHFKARKSGFVSGSVSFDERSAVSSKRSNGASSQDFKDKFVFFKSEKPNEHVSSNNIFNSNVDLDLEMISFALKSGVEVKDRVYHLRQYKDCFLGSEAIDFLVESDLAQSREDALRLGQTLGILCDLFYHVTGNHQLQDDYLFFRFKKDKDRHNIFQSTGHVDMDMCAQALRANLEVGDNTHKLRTYKECFSARDAVDVLIKRSLAASRQDAALIARALGTVCNLFAHVSQQEQDFKDENLFFRFKTPTGLRFGTFFPSPSCEGGSFGGSSWRCNTHVPSVIRGSDFSDSSQLDEFRNPPMLMSKSSFGDSVSRPALMRHNRSQQLLD
mmetsp:Transcript_10865/g.13302  ORF Transcript_10865/g.13302 Transcript_10865/m.13302 type:complete len:714 (+) Transcript_10865:85-2226(+)|eukprot:CAMPEP_0194364166 /NCGR_PEP_ID=MMETSP0174-20130528/12076_1 /TAXON_ID=216777 /ORGANISM="Proboscia alata, Strain PI-D3" /LENGTH=713 /DNA_ID=CAMNT_0039138055 /DNA_START=93 /DNA_END=2234 /DNA_ORIENTATION=+